MDKIYEYLNNYNIELSEESGREVTRDKDVVFTHTGIIVGKNKYTKELMVIHNHIRTGVALVTLSKYADGKHCTYTNRTGDGRNIVLIRAFSQIEQPYTALFFNCQHFSTYALFGKIQSKAVTNIAGLGFLALLLLALSKTRNNTAAILIIVTILSIGLALVESNRLQLT